MKLSTEQAKKLSDIGFKITEAMLAHEKSGNISKATMCHAIKQHISALLLNVFGKEIANIFNNGADDAILKDKFNVN